MWDTTYHKWNWNDDFQNGNNVGYQYSTMRWRKNESHRCKDVASKMVSLVVETTSQNNDFHHRYNNKQS